jgi:DNA-binding CsgD family transcriptional regulator
MGAELDNLRTAMDWATSSGRPAAVIELVVPLFNVWLVRGLLAEMQRRLLVAVDAPAVGPAERARALRTASLLAVGAGDFATGYELAVEAVGLARDHAGPRSLARALRNRFWAGFCSGRSTDTEIAADFEEALELARRVDDPETVASVLMFGGSIDGRGRSLTRSRVRFDQALEVIRNENVPYLAIAAHCDVAMVEALYGGRLDRAREHAQAALRLGVPLGEQFYVSAALGALATVDMLRGDEPAARDHLEEALRVARSAGLRNVTSWLECRRAQVEYRFGDPDTARKAAEGALAAARSLPRPEDTAIAQWLLGGIALRVGDRERAREHLEAARDGSLDPRYAFPLGRSLLGLSYLAETDDDLEEAWDLAHHGLEVLADHGDPVGTADALEAVGAIAARGRHVEQAARLLGAAERLRQETGIDRFPLEAERFSQHLDATRSSLDDQGFDRAWAEGVALSGADAVAYARRGRGERARPVTGWHSLTPSELEVVRLVTTGLGNPEIAERLFISRNTVKTHLGHVYTKLGVSGRAELAAEAARRDA